MSGKSQAPNSGKPYTSSAENKILSEAKNGIPAKQTAKDLGRTEAAIDDKRFRLNHG